MTPNIFFRVLLWPIRLVLVLIPIGILIWLISQHLFITGQLAASYDMKNNSPFISQLSPHDRLSEVKQDNNVFYRTIFDEPIYFDLLAPRRFDAALVKVKFRNHDELDFSIGAGPAYRQAGNGQYELKTLDNKLVNDLLDDKFNWSSVRAGNLLLLQRGGRYQSVADFLTHLPSENRLAVHNYDFGENFILPDYQSGVGLTVEHSLRGALVMYTYIKKETLDFTFTIQDVNRHPGEDPIKVNVYYQKDEPVFSSDWPDDGEEKATMAMSAAREIRVQAPDLKEGYYKIELPVSEDIFFRQIKTDQSRLVFVNRLYLADEVGYWPEPRPATIYTDGRKLTARTPHLEGRQTLVVGQNKMAINQAQRDYFFSIEPDTIQGKRKLTTIVSPKNDILLTTKGIFAFSKESFFDPDITPLAEGLDLTKEGIDFVLAEYPKTALIGSWQVAEIEFDLKKLWPPNNQLRFVLSVPEVSSNKSLAIAGIEIELKREPVDWREFIPKLKNYFIKKIDNLIL